METTAAPFTPEQVAALNNLQASGMFAPYRCAEMSAEAFKAHDDYKKEHPRADPQELVATEAGLVCPGCGHVGPDVPVRYLAFAISRKR